MSDTLSHFANIGHILRQAPEAPVAQTASPTVVSWMDFVRFITDKDLWSRWTFQIDGSSEQYFIEAWAAARDNRLMPNFDFAKTAVTVVSKDETQINWEHDGESLWYFFRKFVEGQRL